MDTVLQKATCTFLLLLFVYEFIANFIGAMDLVGNPRAV